MPRLPTGTFVRRLGELDYIADRERGHRGCSLRHAGLLARATERVCHIMRLISYREPPALYSAIVFRGIYTLALQSAPIALSTTTGTAGNSGCMPSCMAVTSQARAGSASAASTSTTTSSCTA